jgi:hypothetical protein
VATILLRAVVDTSALVPSGLRRQLQQAGEAGLFVPIWSPWIIAELNRVLVWRWIKDPPSHRFANDLSTANERLCSQMARQMMDYLLSTFEVVNPVPPYPPAWTGLSDIGDHPIWAAAVVGQARYVVSENTRDYPPRQSDGLHHYQGIEYLSAQAFLARIRAGTAGNPASG